MTSLFQSMMPSTAVKGGTAPPQHQHTPVPSGSSPFAPTDVPNRRSNNTASPRPASNSRNMQTHRKQNKPHRRPRLQDDEDVLAEQAAVRAASSRRGQTSITHLMSFSLPPRPLNASAHAGRGIHRGATWTIGSGYHAMDKARYIHANYRFIVDPRKNYNAQLMDSDVHLDWEQILQVLATVTEDTSCPICLSTPVAPRMAKCGHIFCLPCVIRYIHSADESDPTALRRRRWQPCPICFDSIFMHEVKAVRWMFTSVSEEPREGRDVTLRLLMRKSKYALALPKETAESTSLSTAPWHFEADALVFAHFMLGTDTYMREQYESEISALHLQENEDALLFGEETTWSQKAISAIQDLKERLEFIKEASHETVPGVMTQPAQSRGSEGFNFYFYQAALQSYLSPLDIRILKTTFGDFDRFPSTLLPRVEHISTGHVVDEEVRRRAKYLSHLPLGYEINFLECDWTDIVPQATLELFRADLEKRKRRNQEKANREEKARVRAEESEDKKLYGNRRNIHRDLDVEPASSYYNWAQASSSVETVVPPRSASWNNSEAHMSSVSAASTSPSTGSGPKTVWGTAAVVSPSLQPPVQTTYDTLTAVDDGWLADWEDGVIGEAELASTVEEIAPAGPRGLSPSFPHSETSSRKKKKRTKITLMSTNGRRAA